jgi:hypothetical protein
VSSMAHHRALCDVAERWLRNAMRCKIVLGGVASCREVPDAIGWSNSWKGGYGSIVVECKRSMGDFRRDRRKQFRKSRVIPSGAPYNALEFDDVKIEIVPRMGDRRYFLCPSEIISVEAVAKHFPDHGLLWLRGRSVYVMREAPRRENVSHATEVVLLKFALIHVRDNLLSAGLSVNLRELTKHPVIADRTGLLEGFVKRMEAAA